MRPVSGKCLRTNGVISQIIISINLNLRNLKNDVLKSYKTGIRIQISHVMHLSIIGSNFILSSAKQRVARIEVGSLTRLRPSIRSLRDHSGCKLRNISQINQNLAVDDGRNVKFHS